MTDRVDIIIREDGSLAVRKRFDDLGESSEKAGSKVSGLTSILSALRPVLGALGLGTIVKEILGFADASTHLQNQLKLVLPTMQELEGTYADLLEISQETTTDFRTNVDMFAQLHRQAKVFGATAQDTRDVTETLAQALNAMGGSGSEAAGTVRALIRTFATGEVSGRSFIQLLNGMPLVLEAISINLGRTPAELKAMGEAGQLSGKMLFDALKKSDFIIEASRQKVDTLADGWGNVKNALIAYFGGVNTSTGVTQALIQSMLLLARHLGTILNLLGVVITTWAAYRAAILLAAASHGIYSVAALISATSTTTAAGATGLFAIALRAGAVAAGLMTVSVGVLAGVVGAFFAIIRAHPFVTLVTILSAAIGLIYAFGNSITLNASGSITLLGAMVGAFRLVSEGINILLGWGKQFAAWLTTTDPGLKTLAASAAFLAVVFYQQLAAAIVGTVIPAIAALSGAVVRLTIAMGAQLLTPIGAATAAFILGAVAVAYYTGTLDTLTKKAGEVAASVTSKIVKTMEEASKSMDKTNGAGKNLAGGLSDLGGDGGPLKKVKTATDSASASMKGYGDRLADTQKFSAALLSAMGDDVGAASIVINEAWHHAADDPDAGIKAYNQRLKETTEAHRRTTLAVIAETKKQADAVQSYVGETTSAIIEHTKKVQEDARWTVNSMGIMVQATDLWAARSGAAYNQITENFKSIGEAAHEELQKVVAAYGEVAKSANAATAAIQNFAGTADLRFSGLPPGFAKMFADEGGDVSEVMRVFGAWARQQGTPGGARAKTDLDRFISQLTAAQRGLLDLFGFQHGADFIVPGSGSGDKTPIRFMAEPGERVRVTSRADQRGGGDSDRQVVTNHFTLSMQVTTPDANSFKESETQMMNRLAAQLSRVVSGSPR